MDLLLDEFKSDLARMKKLQALIALLDGFRAHQKPVAGGNPFLDHATLLHDAVMALHADLLVLSGAMILYLAGRFEFYVRERFEQACQAIGVKSASLDHLPKPMKEHLILMTAEVMLKPRKFGHAEKGVESFVKRLAANMSAMDGVKEINHECLSITMENMRPGVFKDLFDRIGCKDVWQMISEQACVRSHFATVQVAEAKSKCTKYLDDFMDVRNKIAHPSANVEWPNLAKVGEYITYFEVLGKAISDVIDLHEISIPNTIPAPALQPVAPAAPEAAVPAAAPAPAAAAAAQSTSPTPQPVAPAPGPSQGEAPANLAAAPVQQAHAENQPEAQPHQAPDPPEAQANGPKH